MIFYRTIMKLAHRFNWHYAPPLHLEDGATQLWCQWCGFRETTRHGHGPIFTDEELRESAEDFDINTIEIPRPKL